MGKITSNRWNWKFVLKKRNYVKELADKYRKSGISGSTCNFFHIVTPSPENYVKKCEEVLSVTYLGSLLLIPIYSEHKPFKWISMRTAENWEKFYLSGPSIHPTSFQLQLPVLSDWNFIEMDCTSLSIKCQSNPLNSIRMLILHAFQLLIVIVVYQIL